MVHITIIFWLIYCFPNELLPVFLNIWLSKVDDLLQFSIFFESFRVRTGIWHNYYFGYTMYLLFPGNSTHIYPRYYYPWKTQAWTQWIKIVRRLLLKIPNVPPTVNILVLENGYYILAALRYLHSKKSFGWDGYRWSGLSSLLRKKWLTKLGKFAFASACISSPSIMTSKALKK